MDRPSSSDMALVPYQRIFIDTSKKIPPIFGLPIELIAAIFSMIATPYLDECRSIARSNVYSRERDTLRLRTHPILLGVRRVCSYWFHLTSSMPSLWNSVLATPILSRPGERYYIKGHRSVSLVALYMRLSGNAALSLYLKPVDGMNTMADDDDDDKWTTSIEHRFYRLDQQSYLKLYTSHSSQCRSLTVSFTRFMFRLFEELLASTDAVFSRLEALDIDVPDTDYNHTTGTNLSLHISRFFPSLRHLKIINRRGPMNVSNLVQLCQLQTLFLEQRDISSPAIDIIRALTRARSITLVERDVSQQQLTIQPDSLRVNLPFLEELVLKWCLNPEAILDVFTAANLRFLDVHSTGSLRELYPALKRLIYLSECPLKDLAITHSKPDYFGLTCILEDAVLRCIPNCRIKYESQWSLTVAERADQEKVKKYLSKHLDVMRRNIFSSFAFKYTGRFNDDYIIVWDRYASIGQGVMEV